MKNNKIYCAAALLVIATFGSARLSAQEIREPGFSNTTTTVTNATGTISQLNYGEDGAVEGFLLGTNILLTFPTNVTGGVASLGVVGNSVTYSGASQTNSAGFQSVLVTSFTNNTTKATYTSSMGIPISTAYGPASGTIKQLNYDENGLVNAFLFMPGGSTTPILVETGSVTNSALKAALTLGASVSVIGTSPATAGLCTIGALRVVDASSLVINGTTFVLTGEGKPGNGFGRRGHH